MATTFFNLFTRPYSDVGASNFVKVALYKASSPLAIFDSQPADTPGPLDATTWSFPGLPKDNFICRIFEVTADDDVVRQIEGEFTFIPSSSRFDYKNPILIEIGVTEIPGNEPTVFPFDVNTVTVPDWIGWEPMIEKIGSGTMKPDIDYSYDIETGEWTLLIEDDIFQEHVFYWVQFRPIIIVDESVNQYATLFSDVLVVTANTTLTAADIGKKILVKSATSYIEITLPDISTVVENRIAFFEFCQGTLKCCKIKTYSGDIIDWIKKGVSDRNALYGCPNETIELFKEVVDDDASQWRVHNADGNYKTVGQRVAEDQISTGVTNKLLLDGGGTTGVSSDDYARLYYDNVLFLPGAQVCTYANWSSGNNRYLYSLKDSGTGKFHIPDLRDKYMRNSGDTRTAGTFMDHAMLSHRHLTVKKNSGDNEGTLDENGSVNSSKDNGESNGYILSGGGTDATAGLSSKMVNDGGDLITTNTDTEVRPVTVVENYYVLV